MSEPIDIESLDPLYRDVFRDPANGTPDNISKAGCLVLAKLGNGAWNAWRESYPCPIADFSQQKFDPTIWFDGFNFGNYANFSQAEFPNSTKFCNATFGEGANFYGTRFTTCPDFTRAVFGRKAYFVGAQFAVGANFDNVEFGDSRHPETTFFIGAQFGGRSTFKEAKFFENAWFSGRAWNGTYRKIDEKNNAKKWGEEYGLAPNEIEDIDFSHAEFFQRATFTRRIFIGKTSFEAAKFSGVPKFHNSKLSQNTTFQNADWPHPSGSDTATRAYRTLKLAFSQQQAIREEQRFFKLEMAEETKAAPWYKKPLYAAYWAFSDYGFSVARPFILLLATLVIFAALYGSSAGLSACLPFQNACNINSSWAEFSLLQSLPLPGLDKLSDTLRGKLFPTEGLTSIGVTVAVILHKALSLLALFLMGLALRNLFKLK